jgi:hypothetical protein
MARSDTVGPFADIERAIQAGLRDEPVTDEYRPFHPYPRTSDASDIAMPDYVEHRDGATEIGKLSAEAVVREQEATAREIESMSAVLIECVRRCEAVTRDALVATKELNEIAARYRTEAKRVFEHIESCSMLVADARRACVELKDKIAAPITTEAETRSEMA